MYIYIYIYYPGEGPTTVFTCIVRLYNLLRIACAHDGGYDRLFGWPAAELLCYALLPEFCKDEYGRHHRSSTLVSKPSGGLWKSWFWSEWPSGGALSLAAYAWAPRGLEKACKDEYGRHHRSSTFVSKPSGGLWRSWY